MKETVKIIELKPMAGCVMLKADATFERDGKEVTEQINLALNPALFERGNAHGELVDVLFKNVEGIRNVVEIPSWLKVGMIYTNGEPSEKK